MNEAIERFREFVREWKFQDSDGVFPYQLCWRYDNRDESDDIILKYGNEVEFENVFSASTQFVLTVDDWLYCLNANGLKTRRHGGNPILLLYRVSWDNIEIVDVNKIKIIKGGDQK